MKPLRVLYVSGGSLDRGGIASWMLNYAARFDRERVAVDFLVHDLEPGARETEALSLGAKVVHVPFRRNDPANNESGLRACIGAGHVQRLRGYIQQATAPVGALRSQCHPYAAAARADIGKTQRRFGANGQHGLHQAFGLWPGDERIRRHHKFTPKKLAHAQNIGQRLTLFAPRELAFKRGGLLCRGAIVRAHDQGHFVAAQRARQQQLGAQARGVHASVGQA